MTTHGTIAVKWEYAEADLMGEWRKYKMPEVLRLYGEKGWEAWALEQSDYGLVLKVHFKRVVKPPAQLTVGA